MEAPHAVRVLVALGAPALPLVWVQNVPDLRRGLLTTVRVRLPFHEDHPLWRKLPSVRVQKLSVSALVRRPVCDSDHSARAPNGYLQCQV
eukprot:2098495-Prymnesium_polylepis.1